MAGSNFDDPDGFFDRVLNSSSGQSQFWARRSFWGALLMTVALLTLVTVIWLSYVNAPDIPSEDQLPIIQADQEPFRIAPEDPGGIVIPNQDSTVFDATRGGQMIKDRPVIENLLADIEESIQSREDIIEKAEMPDAPIDTPKEAPKAVEVPEQGVFPEPTKTDDAEEPLDFVRSVLDRKDLNTKQQTEEARRLVEATAEKATETVTNTVEAVTAPKPTPKPEQVAVSEQEATPETTPEFATTPVIERKAPDVAVASVPQNAVGPDRYIQLGSFKDQAAATRQFEKTKAAFPAFFDGIGLRIQDVDLGEKGTYHRSQAGPVAENIAKAICDAIKQKQAGGCLIVKP